MRIVVMLLVLLVLLGVPSRGDACSGRFMSVYELFDRATTVAYVRVGPVPPRAGAVRLSVKRVIKGAKANTLRTFENNTSCAIGFRRGASAVVFLDDDGDTIGQQGYRERFQDIEESLDAFAAATSEVGRRSVLVDAITTGSDRVSHEATMFLLDEPGLIVKLDKDQQQAILAAGRPKDFAMPLLHQRIRGGRFDTLSDPSKLADLIAAGKGSADPTRIAALERCERVHAKKLFEFTSYHDGVGGLFWNALAEACRTGVAIRS
jgi:hypothetical protein